MRLKRTLLLIATLSLSGCAAPPLQMPTPIIDSNRPAFIVVPMIGVSMECANHTNNYIHSYAVQEPLTLAKGMVSALNCNAHEMGQGTVAAGYMLPKEWRPGMKVKVRWNRPINGMDNWIEKITTIRRYDKAGTLTVHFFINDEVRLVSAPIYAAGSLHHPILKNVTIAPPEEE